MRSGSGCALVACWLVGSFLVASLDQPVVAQAVPDNVTSAAVADSVDAWFMVGWSAAEPSVWDLKLAIESDGPASFVGLENHCTSDASTGAIDFTPGEPRVSINTREPSQGGMVRVRLRAPLDASLACYRAGSDDPVRVRVADLLSASAATEITTAAPESKSGLVWKFERTPQDSLRVDLVRTSKMIPINEPLAFSLGVHHHASRAGFDVILKYSLVRVDGGETIATQSWAHKLDESGSSPLIEVTTPALTEPGIYELRALVETTDEGLWGKIRRRKETLLESGVAVVVLGTDAAKLSAEVTALDRAPTPWQLIQTIRPADAKQWTFSRIVPATTDALMSTIQSGAPSTLSTIQHAEQAVSSLAAGAMCEFKLAVDGIGKPHVVTLRYPAAAGAKMRIEIRSSATPLQPRASFAIHEDAIGIDHSPWSTHSFVHYPGSRDESIRLTNLDASQAVSFHSIQVTGGPSRLTHSPRMVTPKSGATGEVATIVALSLRDFGWVEQLTPDFEARSEFAALLPESKSLHRLRVATRRLADYAHACGMNRVILPANQGGRLWFETGELSRRFLAPAEFNERLRLVLDQLDQSNIGAIVSLEPTMSLATVEAGIRNRNPSSTTAGSPPLDALRGGSDANLYQPLESVVATSIARLISDLEVTCRPHACFDGLSLACTATSHLAPIDIEQPFSPAIMNRFVSSSPELMEALAKLDAAEANRRLDAWRRGEGRVTFARWMTREQRRLLERLASPVNGHVLLRVPQSSLYVAGETAIYDDHWPTLESKLYPVYEHQGGGFGSLSLQHSQAHRLNSITTLEPTHAKTTVVAIGETDSPDGTAAAVMHESLAMDLARCIERLQPRAVILDCNVVTGSLSPPVIRSLQAIASAPIGRLGRVDCSDPTAHPERIYHNPANDGLLLLNLAPWSTDVVLSDASKSHWIAAAESNSLPDLAYGTPLDASPPSSTQPGAFGLVAGEARWLRTESGQPAKISDWASHPAGGEVGLARIKAAVTRIVERIGVFSEPSDYAGLANGGFEQASAVGIVGWLSAQHPPDAVRIDTEASEGTQSVCLTTDARSSTRTWLVSETFTAPTSGRLAVSLACRGELNDPSATVATPTPAERTPGRLRIAIEGTRRGEAFRRTTEIEMPHDGRWQNRRIVLEWDAIDPRDTQSLRLTMDSLTPGRVWIDDVHLHDWFPLESERNDLQGQSFLAVQGLQRGNITPAARLMRNDWARYLMTLPVDTPQRLATSSPARSDGNPRSTTSQPSSWKEAAIEVESTNSNTPGMAERLRSWLPRPLRF